MERIYRDLFLANRHRQSVMTEGAEKRSFFIFLPLYFLYLTKNIIIYSNNTMLTPHSTERKP